MTKTLFGKKDNTDIFLYTLENKNGVKAVLSNYGALITELWVPDKNGETADVCLGYDTLEEYLVNGNFYGALIAPNANRIGGAAFTINGKEYKLDVNDGDNNLHSHRDLGAHKLVWDAQEEENAVTFTLQMKDMELGFPGNKEMKVRYELTDANELRLIYDITSDCDTVINPTQHCYFNLNGHGSGTINNHKIQINASAYTPTYPGSIPTGEIASVVGTPMDFLQPHAIGERCDDAFEQLTLAGGYDHNWVLDGFDGSVRKVVEVSNESGTRTMEVYTDLPGMQFYAGNFMKDEIAKKGKTYGYRTGFALETQYYPDTPNRPEFPGDIFGPERPYHSETIYKFV